MVQQLYPEDKDGRVEMCSLLSSKISEEDDGDQFGSSLWFSDEATFHVSGVVNRHNCVIWGEENSRVIREYEQNSSKLHVWCAISDHGIMGPFFSRENNNTVSVTGERYLKMLQDFFLPELRQMGCQPEDITFQHDGAPTHFLTWCHGPSQLMRSLSRTFEQVFTYFVPLLYIPSEKIIRLNVLIIASLETNILRKVITYLNTLWNSLQLSVIAFRSTFLLWRKFQAQ